MIVISIQDPRVDRAVELVKKTHMPSSQAELERIFESQYHCKIVPDSDNPWCTTGNLYIGEDKYYHWFLLQFGEGDE